MLLARGLHPVQVRRRVKIPGQNYGDRLRVVELALDAVKGLYNLWNASGLDLVSENLLCGQIVVVETVRAVGVGARVNSPEVELRVHDPCALAVKADTNATGPRDFVVFLDDGVPTDDTYAFTALLVVLAESPA